MLQKKIYLHQLKQFLPFSANVLQASILELVNQLRTLILTVNPLFIFYIILIFFKIFNKTLFIFWIGLFKFILSTMISDIL